MKIRSKISRTRLIAIFAIVTALSITGVSIGTYLLTSYGTVETTANVEQAVLIDGGDWEQSVTHEFDVVGGCTKMVKHKILNQACIDAEIEFYTDVNDAVDVAYYVMDGWSHLLLENKNENWQPIDDEYYADFWWNPCCPLLDWKLEGMFLPETEYVLIYYADQPDRFTNWGGAPAFEIATFTSSADGSFLLTGQSEINSCLPYSTDWNIGPDADYTQPPDGYDHGKGAKIWLVPSYIYDGIDTELTGWVPDEILFETDLIFYGDCDIDPLPPYIYPYFEYETPVTGYTIPSGEEICWFIEYYFAINTIPYTGVFTTDVIPVVGP